MENIGHNQTQDSEFLLQRQSKKDNTYLMLLLKCVRQTDTIKPIFVWLRIKLCEVTVTDWMMRIYSAPTITSWFICQYSKQTL